MKNNYGSPRWSQELLDCSMPMTFDTYNKCSYNCLYCFSYFQKSKSAHKNNVYEKVDYQNVKELTSVNVEKVKNIFLLKSKSEGDRQFFDYVRDKKVMQYGGLADQFDEYERKHGTTYEILKFLKSINYPICFSTKSTWFMEDPRYIELFKDQDNWNCKFTIINLNEKTAKEMEKGVDSPARRIAAIRKYTSLNKGGATLRLRPFIIGLSDRKDEYLDLIKQAKDAGATAVSTEFFCMDGRADDRLKDRYKQMSEIIGYDIWDYYRKNSSGAGYYRLNYFVKKPFMEKMSALCDKIGLRFYVSDANHKEKCHNGSCCGLPESWNYCRGQFTEALMIAKKTGRVEFSQISKYLDMFKKIPWTRTTGYNVLNSESRALRQNQSLYDFIREIWNTPNAHRSPYKYFGGILIPKKLDANGDVIYYYKDYKK